MISSAYPMAERSDRAIRWDFIKTRVIVSLAFNELLTGGINGL